jgi:hypothetical protein
MTSDEAQRGAHLHLDDCPQTLRLLAALFEPKMGDPVGLAEIGAWVDWEALTASWLSSTELAIVHIARGCAILEPAGGPPPRLHGVLLETIAAVSPPVELPADWA